jgi:quercetin dioxygenase-like cupin family protein
MHIVEIEDAFEDSRGIIRDLIVDDIHSVTEISFTPNSVRGNHVHQETTQWTYVLFGELQMATIQSGVVVTQKLIPGDFVVSLPNEPHAFKSTTHSKILVFTKGLRSGMNYELDTHRIEIIQ